MGKYSGLIEPGLQKTGEATWIELGAAIEASNDPEQSPLDTLDGGALYTGESDVITWTTVATDQYDPVMAIWKDDDHTVSLRFKQPGDVAFTVLDGYKIIGCKKMLKFELNNRNSLELKFRKYTV